MSTDWSICTLAFISSYASCFSQSLAIFSSDHCVSSCSIFPVIPLHSFYNATFSPQSITSFYADTFPSLLQFFDTRKVPSLAKIFLILPFHKTIFLCLILVSYALSRSSCKQRYKKTNDTVAKKSPNRCTARKSEVSLTHTLVNNDLQASFDLTISLHEFPLISMWHHVDGTFGLDTVPV